MRRESRFVMSHKPFAVDLSSLHVDDYSTSRVTAVWFRRRRRGGYGPNGAVVTVACVGTLWKTMRPVPSTAAEFLERHTDGRHGGSCDGRWDGSGYWGAEDPDVMAEHLAVLRPMLDGYVASPKSPPIPDGYDGWWTFQ